MRAVVCASLLLAVAGCNALFGLDGVTLDDGGTTGDGGHDGPGSDGVEPERLPTRVRVCDKPRKLLVVAADPSNDLDLITSCANRLGITLNTGLRTYGSTSTLTTNELSAIAAGDINNDGWIDLVAADQLTLSLYAGNGAGAFALLDNEIQAGITALEVGNLLSDDEPADVAAAIASGVLIYPGSPGGLGTPQPVAQTSTIGVAILDADNDNLPDVAIATADDKITVRRQGRGYIADGGDPVGGGPMAVGKLDDDLAAMVVTAIGTPTLAIAVAIGGRLEAGDPAELPARASAVAAGDLDGDGLDDVAVLSADTQILSLFKNTGARGLSPGQALILDAIPADLVIADLDGDRHNDVAVTMTNLGEVWIFWGPL